MLKIQKNRSSFLIHLCGLLTLPKNKIHSETTQVHLLRKIAASKTQFEPVRTVTTITVLRFKSQNSLKHRGAVRRGQRPPPRFYLEPAT